MARTNERIGLSVETLTPILWLGIALAAITGAMHLYLYAVEGFLPFLLGGLGYFGAIVLLLVLPGYRRWLYLVGIPYVLVHVVGWVMAGMPPGGWELAAAPVVTFGTVNKVVEVALLAVLAYLSISGEAVVRPAPDQERAG